MEEMSPRERVLTALSHKEPDRVPLDLGSLTSTIESTAYDELKSYLKLMSEKNLFLETTLILPRSS